MTRKLGFLLKAYWVCVEMRYAALFWAPFFSIFLSSSLGQPTTNKANFNWQLATSNKERLEEGYIREEPNGLFSCVLVSPGWPYVRV